MPDTIPPLKAAPGNGRVAEESALKPIPGCDNRGTVAPSLVDQIEQDALDSKVSVSDALRKCVALGGRAHSEELRTWASQELRGYAEDDELPDYRVIQAPIALEAALMGGIVSNQPISASQLPDIVQEKVSETLKIQHSVAEIDDFANNAAARGEAAKFSLPKGAEIARYMNHKSGDPSQQITSIYWMVSPSTLRGIVDQVRTRLVELVAELRDQMEKGEDIPSPEAAANAVSVAVYGRGNRISVNAPQASSGGSSSVTTGGPASWWTPWRRVGAVIVGLATVAGAIFGLLQLLE